MNKKERKRKRERAKLAARRKAALEAKEFPDKRGISTEVLAQGGVPVTEETHIAVIEPIRLATGEELWFQSPHITPFYLLISKQFRDAAEPKRVDAVTKTATTPDGSLRPLDAEGAFDALEGLVLSVILAAAAIEAHANDMIGRLPEDATVTVDRKSMAVVYERDSMERALRLGEKLNLVGPLLTGKPSIKGTAAWAAYRRVVKLRNELVHPRREVEDDPDDPSPYGRLMKGEGSKAPEDAAAVIEAVEPGWIPGRLRSEFGF
jgi:hypothetical protein